MFPAPREVDRWIYAKELVQHGDIWSFPSPLEVDRFLYAAAFVLAGIIGWVSGPSRGG